MDLCAKYLNGFYKTAFYVIVASGLVGCQKQSSPEATSTQVESLSCPNSQLKANIEQMQLEGSSEAAIGEIVQYKLNSDALCSGAQKVLWNTPGAQKVATSNGAVAATYSAPGNYFVSAKLVGASSPDLVQKTLVIGDQIQFTGPQVTTQFTENTFTLTAPSGASLSSILWNFGDGVSQTTTANSIIHSYNKVGEYLINVTATDSNGVITTLQHLVSVIPGTDELFCAVQLSLSGASQTTTGSNNVFSAFIPSCLSKFLLNVSWDFGDNSSAVGETVNKIYSQVGDYTIHAVVHLNHATLKQISITKEIQVNAPIVDNNKCSTLGQTKETLSAPYIEVEACGINGHKDVTYQDRKQEACQRVGDILDWVVITTQKEKKSELACQGQSCPAPGLPSATTIGLQLINGQYYLAHGTSLEFFTQSSPINSCEQNKEIRSCDNGTLSGSAQAIQYQCLSGCGDFGSNGTVQTGINIGTQQVAVQCQFGEQGVFDIFNQIEDRACQNGTINSSNQRLGDLISKGSCPTYSFISTEQYTSCNADCGGTQSLIYECKNNSGLTVNEERCAGQSKPVVTRLCDANAEAVRRIDISSETQTDNSNKCPKNQIGVIIDTREAITKKSYACINHEVALENITVEYTPWTEERYCRDYVAHRCSNDSLNNTQAHNRFLWMQKCASQSPVIAEFLENFDSISKDNFTIDTTSRILYPTFMDRSKKPEKTWIAPTSASAPCNIPNSVYIASVCVSSCVIPQEKILAQRNATENLSPVAFVDALTHHYDRVATLAAGNSINSRPTQLTKVDQWITELEDTVQPVLIFTMKSGKTLTVTPNHPLLRADGSMSIASQFKVKDALVKVGGSLDEIKSIEPQQYSGKVYNLFVKSSVPQENIVITNGYLNGSAFFQNEGANYVNTQLLRSKLIHGVFNK